LTPIQKELRDLMQFQLFDVVLTEGLDGSPVLDDTRLKVIANYFDGKDIVEVTHFEDTFTEDNVKKYMKTVLDLGYEGLMVKVPGHPYVHERSKMIFKHKPLLDDDFEITGFLESLTGNTLGSIEFKMPGTNKIFSATPKDDWGTDAMKKIIWDNQSDYKGKFATVEFLEYTPDGVPRHGRVKGFRKGKSKD
jgi:ATP-dependent DNA ligase